MRNPKTRHVVFAGAVATASAVLLAGAMIMVSTAQTMANPAIAAKEKKPCAACHTTPPALNDAGKKYKAGH
jgi:hypothetical protein